MALIRYTPARGFEGLYRRMNKLMNEFEKNYSSEKIDYIPKADVYEDDKYIYSYLELPGIAKDDVKISMNDDNILTIKGEKKQESVKEGKAFVKTERRFGEFTRSFLLPDNIDSNSINAKFDSGVLLVTIPKKEPEKPKEYDIQIA